MSPKIFKLSPREALIFQTVSAAKARERAKDAIAAAARAFELARAKGRSASREWDDFIQACERFNALNEPAKLDLTPNQLN
ncbi:hypothetical protein SH580_19690 [Coraliomargarita algicola]|uniref:Uncharacterized protein n=1 Tax=Coraliomargarita algicola TaxID=3092156 RepID=A0ABZ0RRS0_9BACT|nr:hypothetical protein [Coraliomargarita sp. J2-16]WPJ95644.1 hypothetical protein SH580_19690 [Coraliomargarita sp. J2-16]